MGQDWRSLYTIWPTWLDDVNCRADARISGESMISDKAGAAAAGRAEIVDVRSSDSALDSFRRACRNLGRRISSLREASSFPGCGRAIPSPTAAPLVLGPCAFAIGTPYNDDGHLCLKPKARHSFYVTLPADFAYDQVRRVIVLLQYVDVATYHVVVSLGKGTVVAFRPELEGFNTGRFYGPGDGDGIFTPIVFTMSRAFKEARKQRLQSGQHMQLEVVGSFITHPHSLPASGRHDGTCHCDAFKAKGSVLFELNEPETFVHAHREGTTTYRAKDYIQIGERGFCNADSVDHDKRWMVWQRSTDD